MKKIILSIATLLISVPFSAFTQVYSNGIVISNFSITLCGNEKTAKEINVIVKNFIETSPGTLVESLIGLKVPSNGFLLVDNTGVMPVKISMVNLSGVYVNCLKDSLHNIVFIQYDFKDFFITILFCKNEASPLYVTSSSTFEVITAILLGRLEIMPTQNDGSKETAVALSSVSDLLYISLNSMLCDEDLIFPATIKQ